MKKRSQLCRENSSRHPNLALRKNCDSERGERASGFCPSCCSQLIFLPLSSPLFDAKKTAARLAAAIRCVYLYIQRWRRHVVSKLRIRLPYGLRGRSFARYTLCNPCMQMITYVHITVVCQLAATASSSETTGDQPDIFVLVKSMLNDSAISLANFSLIETYVKLFCIALLACVIDFDTNKEINIVCLINFFTSC